MGRASSTSPWYRAFGASGELKPPHGPNGPLMHVALRALIACTLIVLLLVAALQVSGRLATLWVNDARVAELLQRYAPDLPLHATGVELRWHRFNPVLSIAQLRLGDSRVDGALVKLDAIESLARWGLVFAHAQNTGALLRFERSESGGWALAGVPPGEGGPNLRKTIEHSDQLRLNAELQFGSGAASAIALAVNARNEDSVRRWSIRLMEPQCQAQCQLAVEIEERLRVPLLQSASLAIDASVSGDGVRLPAPLLGGTSLRVAQADVRWDASNRDWRRALQPQTKGSPRETLAAQLQVALRLTDVQLPGGVPFDVAIGARGSSHPGYALARTFAGTVALGETVVALPEFWLRWIPDHLQLYAQRLDLTTALAQVARSRDADDELGGWLRRLSIQGELTDLQAQRRLDLGGWAWQARLADAALSGYQGAPTADSLSGDVYGYERGMRARIAAPTSTVGFPGVFDDLWPVRDFSAELDLHWRPGALALIGHRVDAHLVQGDASAPPMQGSFRLAVPADRLEQVLALQLRTSALSFNTAKRFLPSKLNPDLRRWLLTAPGGGELNDLHYAYFGHTRNQQGPTARRAALRATVQNASVRFDPRWPSVTGLAGTLALSGQEARALMSRGTSRGVDLANTRIVVPAGGKELQVALQAAFDGARGLEYIRHSPLARTLPFIDSDWTSEGAMRVKGDVQVTLGAGVADAPAQANLAIQLIDTDLAVPGMRLSFTGLNGALQFRSPAQLSGQDLAGSLHGRSLQFAVRSDDAGIAFDVQGATDPGQVYTLLGLDDPGFATGSSSYQGTVRFPGDGSAPELDMQTTLSGIALELPGELAKAAADVRPTRIQATFGAVDQQVTVAQRPLDATLTVRDGAVVGGLVELRGQAPRLADEFVEQARARADPSAPGVIVRGALASLPLAAGGEGGLFGPVPVRLEALKIDALLASDTTDLGAVAISGTLQGPDMNLQLFGEGIAGTVVAQGDAPLAIDLTHLHLPDTNEAAPLAELDVRLVADPDFQRERVQVRTLVSASEDPLPVSLIAELPAARIAVDQVRLGDDDFGQWQFTLEPAPGSLRITELEAQVRGVEIQAPAMTWHQEPNETRFTGTLRAGNLAEVLPLWDYAATLSTETTEVEATLQWPGSPVNVNLLTMSGDVDFKATDGRFQDVEAGNNALRIFSLLNFSALAKRMNLDFSDVLGRGISFEELTAPVTLAAGDLRFRSPMEVQGTGSSFRLSGTVDLNTGALANDMVVTLPLTKGLPWYAAYVAIANPLAGLGVLVGERVLRKPLEQFSSARYRVTGTLDAPKARLVSIFDNEMETEVPADAALATATPAPEPDKEPNKEPNNELDKEPISDPMSDPIPAKPPPTDPPIKEKADATND